MSGLQIWGGVECTVNRVRDCWHDQLELSGHAYRIEDLQSIADLGIRTLRYPILWERVAPRSPDDMHWSWSDERLNRLRALSISPIVGLLHHGSGPRYTGLLEGNFPSQFAGFAAAVAARYPWVDQYTPINEPLTTARFSGLYGHWYPHHRDDRSFARAFINQCRAIALAMSAIRRVNPNAQLVQTEDLGTTYSTSHMQYQQRFDNERRWLTWDILSGRVDRQHPMRPFLECSGITADELDWFTHNPSPPQIVGINHYVTSDRYLDDRTRLYPPATHGRNTRESYSDIDAVRVMPGDYSGWKIIQSAAARYQLPVALTEVHIGCTREEQLRWFEQAYAAAGAAQKAGCDVRAVTAWSLFGSFNWDKLLTQTNGIYEPGAFDVRSPRPRATAIATLIRRRTGMPVPGEFEQQLPSLGWWQREDKVLYGTFEGTFHPNVTRIRQQRSRPVLICGASGVLGHACIAECERRALPFLALSRCQLDNTDSLALGKLCDDVKPWAIINAAGFVGVDQAEHSVRECYRDNVEGARSLAAAADARKIPFATFSSDLVFDGHLASPYVESDAAAPLNVYGMSKLASEAATMIYRRTLCIRTAGFFGAWNGNDFLSQALIALGRGMPYTAINDITVSPTFLPDLASATLDLLIDEYTGLVHLVNKGALTWAGMVALGAEAAGVSLLTLRQGLATEMHLPARRPRYSALQSERLTTMPSLDSALERFSYAYRTQRQEQRAISRNG